MAVRIRADMKTIICAANSEAEDGDCYLDDHVHYVLASAMGALQYVGANLWEFRTPAPQPTEVTTMNPD